MKSKKTLVLVLAIVLLVVIVLGSYEAIVLSGNNNAANFNVEIAGAFSSTGVTVQALPSQVETGTNVSLALYVNHTSTDTITLRISGSAAEWSYFGYYTHPPTDQMLAKSEITVSEAVNGALVIISVPQDAMTGSYQLIVTGTNNADKTVSDTYTFSVN